MSNLSAQSLRLEYLYIVALLSSTYYDYLKISIVFLGNLLEKVTLFYDLTRDSIANNFVIDFYCRQGVLWNLFTWADSL